MLRYVNVKITFFFSKKKSTNVQIKGTVNDKGSYFSKIYFFALWLDKVLKSKLPKKFSQNHEKNARYAKKNDLEAQLLIT